jgi:hypothetical protein
MWVGALAYMCDVNCALRDRLSLCKSRIATEVESDLTAVVVEDSQR